MDQQLALIAQHLSVIANTLSDKNLFYIQLVIMFCTFVAAISAALSAGITAQSAKQFRDARYDESRPILRLKLQEYSWNCLHLIIFNKGKGILYNLTTNIGSAALSKTSLHPEESLEFSLKGSQNNIDKIKSNNNLIFYYQDIYKRNFETRTIINIEEGMQLYVDEDFIQVKNNN